MSVFSAEFDPENQSNQPNQSNQSNQPNQPYSILFVCTGNICRSPLAESLLQSRLTALGLDVRVSSAGTFALVGQSMTAQSEALATRFCADANLDHSSTQLTTALVAEADLILTATREHSHAVAILHPRSARFTFTLPQFARFIDHHAEEAAIAEPQRGPATPAGPATITDLVAEIVSSRGFVPPAPDPTIDDIEDPYQQPQETYDRVGHVIEAAVQTVAGYFAPAGGTR